MVGAEGFDRFSSDLDHIKLIFLDLPPILVNWSDIWDYGSQIGRIWADSF